MTIDWSQSGIPRCARCYCDLCFCHKPLISFSSHTVSWGKEFFRLSNSIWTWYMTIGNIYATVYVTFRTFLPVSVFVSVIRVAKRECLCVWGTDCKQRTWRGQQLSICYSFLKSKSRVFFSLQVSTKPLSVSLCFSISVFSISLWHCFSLRKFVIQKNFQEFDPDFDKRS